MGGLQGVIEIARSVSDGVYDLEAGVKLVSSLYQVDEIVARGWIGTPKAIPNV